MLSLLPLEMVDDRKHWVAGGGLPYLGLLGRGSFHVLRKKQEMSQEFSTLLSSHSTGEATWVSAKGKPPHHRAPPTRPSGDGGPHVMVKSRNTDLI